MMAAQSAYGGGGGDGNLLMTYHTFHSEIWVPRPPAEVFAFFSDAHNLEQITPPWVRFQVVTPAPIVMRAGTLIDYKIRVRRLSLKWRTEITEWCPPERFIDTQLRGPYVRWEHTHSFTARDGGTLCTDDVLYWPRGGFLAPLIHALFVRRDVEKIFAYRAKVLREKFGE